MSDRCWSSTCSSFFRPPPSISRSISDSFSWRLALFKWCLCSPPSRASYRLWVGTTSLPCFFSASGFLSDCFDELWEIGPAGMRSPGGVVEPGEVCSGDVPSLARLWATASFTAWTSLLDILPVWNMREKRLLIFCFCGLREDTASPCGDDAGTGRWVSSIAFVIWSPFGSSEVCDVDETVEGVDSGTDGFMCVGRK
ncbi:hypothetical protein I7I50_00456 [Histoplasma capsulatum G186AR]|uniref:Uncharacterized protein n=1 Tax=Ajellomyces capsulatus TaxID=5037 RepID=A0A8H8CUU5_AJECA|nr:hypothetical protein I7I52_07724 [Histoplasma capsulatum]QSS72570.1 hypothetical protein I7I50_00456 [Histoplasma capsulatum G186AR]